MTSCRLHTIVHFFCKVFHAMQLDKGLPFEKLRIALISKWLHTVGSLSPLMRRYHLSKLTFEDSLTDRQLVSAMNFLIGKYCYFILSISHSFHWCKSSIYILVVFHCCCLFHKWSLNPLCDILTHKWLLWKWLECHTQRIITFGWVPFRP